MEFLGHDVQYAPAAGRPGPAGLFHDERHGRGFIQQTQFAILVRGHARVSVDATVGENVVDVPYQCANVSGRCPPGKTKTKKGQQI
jgi:hypothetical protein